MRGAGAFGSSSPCQFVMDCCSSAGDPFELWLTPVLIGRFTLASPRLIISVCNDAFADQPESSRVLTLSGSKRKVIGYGRRDRSKKQLKQDLQSKRSGQPARTQA